MSDKDSKRRFKLIYINLAVLLVLLLVVEVGLHIYFLNTDNSKALNYASMKQLNSRSLKPQYSPHRYLGYYATPNWQKGKNLHNSMGFRGNEITNPKPKESFRIICIGGSTTYTSGVEDYTLSYPFLLQNELEKKGFEHIEVINAGVGNWSSWESMINLQIRLLDLEPDMLVIYHSTNDIQPRIVWPPEKYQSDNQGRRQAVKQHLTPSWKGLIFEKSNILRIISIKARLKIPNTVLERIDPAPDSYHLPEFIRQIEEDIYPSGFFKEVPVSLMLETNKPVYFRRNLEGIVDLARSRGIEVVMATFAHCSGFEDEFSSTEEYEAAYKQHNELIREVAIQKGVSCLDFANIFPDDVELFADGRHVNEKGTELKASIFAQFIGKELKFRTSQ